MQINLILLLWSQMFSIETIIIDHKNMPNQAVFPTINLQDKEAFKVRIINTDKSKFNYLINEAPQAEAEEINSRVAVTEDLTIWESKPYIHKRGTPGYYIKATLKSLTEADERLSEKFWLIPTKTQTWNIDFFTGFSVSENTDPIFGINQDDMTIFSNKGAEDEAALGVVGSALFHHDNHKNFAWALSLNIAENKTGYAFGPSYRFGNRGAVSLQGHFSPVKRLPAGLKVGDTVTDPNALNDLSSKNDFGVSLAFSVKLGGINVGDIFKKPFAANPN